MPQVARRQRVIHYRWFKVIQYIIESLFASDLVTMQSLAASCEPNRMFSVYFDPYNIFCVVNIINLQGDLNETSA